MEPNQKHNLCPGKRGMAASFQAGPLFMQI